MPAPLTGRIRFDPPLPVDRAHLTHRMPIGAVTKIGVIYDDAWWRADGLNATSLDVDSPVSLTLDGCAQVDAARDHLRDHRGPRVAVVQPPRAQRSAGDLVTDAPGHPLRAEGEGGRRTTASTTGARRTTAAAATWPTCRRGR